MTEETAHPPKPSLCIVNFNGENYLEETLGAVSAQKERFREVLLVDNASKDRSLEIVKKQFPFVKVIRLAENRGPAVARNVAFESASSNWILFLDNDVRISSDCADLMLESLRESPRAVMAMPCVLYANSEEIVQYDGAEAHFLGLMSLQNEDRPLSSLPTGTRRIGSIVTACFLLDRARWGKDKPFDETFFIYLEDHDFALRGRALGHEILSVPRARVYHREGTKGLSLRGSGRYTDFRVFCLIRNRWLVILKNYSLRSILLLSPILAVYELCQIAVVIKKGWIRPWARAFVWTVRNWASMLRKRRNLQNKRHTPDRELLMGGPIPLREELTKSRFERLARSVLSGLCASYWKLIRRMV
jgi:GT2 family glycosyltransferase